MADQTGLFGRTRSFATIGPAARRVAVIDVGSNSVRLVVFDGNARSPAYFFNEKVLCGLGQGLAGRGTLHPEGRARALATLRRFAALAERMRVGALEAVATAAVREASDGAEFLAEVERETGLRVRIASGEDEARLSAQGVLVGRPDAEGVVADTGGASMELARLSRGAVRGTVTTPLGPFPLRDLGLSGPALNRHVRDVLARAWEELAGPVPELFLVGGAWRALGRAHMRKTAYPLPVLQDYPMEPAALMRTARRVAECTPAELAQRWGVSASRAPLLPLNARVMIGLLKTLRPDRVTLSAYGLREGILWEKMTPRARMRDPLIEACRFLESRHARFPGFGAQLFAWLRPLIGAGEDAGMLRLAEAACLLHDVNWRGHPDFRAEMGFETVIRASIAGIDHPGRVFIGLALSFRYGGGRPDGRLLALHRRAGARGGRAAGPRDAPWGDDLGLGAGRARGCADRGRGWAAGAGAGADDARAGRRGGREAPRRAGPRDGPRTGAAARGLNGAAAVLRGCPPCPRGSAARPDRLPESHRCACPATSCRC
ncbi:MAG: exopolyphosphatase [Paracoccaceae bacterium]|nr:MAG: exopolyphosphatase [Paracoccaceae bacterium]